MSQSLPGLVDIDESDLNYENHAPRVANTAIQRLNQLVKLAHDTEAEVKKLKSEVAVKERTLKRLLEVDIPSLMTDECGGLKMLETEDGLVVKIDTTLWANIPAPTSINKEKDPDKRQAMIDRREAAIKWLEENDHHHLIQRDFTVQFEKGDEAWARKFRADLAKRKKKLHVVEGESVHSGSLSAMIRSLSAQNDMFPRDILGVHERTTTSIKQK
jgi:hypothetical protein